MRPPRPRYPRVASVFLLLTTAAAGFWAGVAWQGRRAPQSADADAVAGAPPSRGPEARAADRDEEAEGDRERRRLVIDEIGLPPETRAQAGEIIRHFRSRMRTLDQEFQEAYRPRHAEIVRRTRDSIRSILAPEQVLAYDSLLTVRYEGRGQRGSRGRGGKR